MMMMMMMMASEYSPTGFRRPIRRQVWHQQYERADAFSWRPHLIAVGGEPVDDQG
jgi:hypothetical protein